jgi:hypothetical protein
LHLHTGDFRESIGRGITDARLEFGHEWRFDLAAASQFELSVASDNISNAKRPAIRHHKKMIGRQLILRDPELSVRQPLTMSRHEAGRRLNMPSRLSVSGSDAERTSEQCRNIP